MPFTPLTFSQLQAIFATQYSSQAAIPANTNPGSTLGAIGNAAALMNLNVQQELIYIDSVARGATSTGSDLDSFYAPFGITRYGESPSSGLVTMSTPSPLSGSQQVVIPVGGIVTTSGGLQFVIQADPLNVSGFFNANLNGYVIANGSSASVLVTCSVSGTVGNVAANQITQIYNASNIPVISGISLNNGVTNALPFTNGGAQELDPQFYFRAQTQMSTGKNGTDNALISAILGTQPGLTYSLGDGLNQYGVAVPGLVSIYVNSEGSGIAAPGTLISAVQGSVNAVKVAGITTLVYGPAIVPVSVTATIHSPIGTSSSTVQSALTTAFNAYVNAIGLNASGGTTACNFFNIASTLLGVSGVTSIDSVLVNGGTGDLVAPFGSQFVAGTSSFTVLNP